MSIFPSIIKTFFLQRNMISFLKQSEKWSKHQWHQYQLHELKTLLHHCNTHVPYYHQIFKKYDINIDTIQSFDDFRKIPFLTKKDIQLHSNELKAQNYPNNAFDLKKTSGTTEEPLHIYVKKHEWLAFHLAFNKMFMIRGGYTRGKKVVSILGIPKKSRYHLFFNTLELSSLHLHQAYDEIILKIKKFNPYFIVSYPSAIYFLAKFLKDTDQTAPFSIQSIFCHGEPVYDWQRKIIEKMFSCQVYDIYGNGERCVLSATCKHSSLHHIFPNYCIVELIDAQGNPITQEDAPGEIVSTGLLSHIFPFIRYKTGDVGIYTNKECSCERNYPVIKSITGRLQDAVLTKHNKLIHASSLYEVIDRFGKGVSTWQFHQSKKGKLHLHITVFKQYQDSYAEIKNKIQKAFNETFQNGFDLSISLVDPIAHHNVRKHLFLIQTIPVDQMMLSSF